MHLKILRKKLKHASKKPIKKPVSLLVNLMIMGQKLLSFHNVT